MNGDVRGCEGGGTWSHRIVQPVDVPYLAL